MLLALSACGAPAPGNGEAPPELHFTNFVLYEYEHGELAFSASAKNAAGSRHHLDLQGIDVHHRGSKESGALQISSERGSIDVDSNGFLLDGKVSVVDASGRHLVTDHAAYDPNGKRFDVPGAVNMIGSDLNFHAAGVQGTTDSEELTFKGPVEGSFKMNKKK